jgi:hypothetical protein
MANRITDDQRREAAKLSHKATGSWSKWGGARLGFLQAEGDTWYCQVCAEEQDNILPSFKHELYPNEFIKTCSRCFALIQMQKTLDEIHDLLDNHGF